MTLNCPFTLSLSKGFLAWLSRGFDKLSPNGFEISRFGLAPHA